MNINNIRNEIEKKKQPYPYFATVNTEKMIVTDYDSFPYQRWFRGVPTSNIPIVAEREAGWRLRKDNCYKAEQTPQLKFYPKHCFESGCSVVYPCNPSTLDTNADSGILSVLMSDSCVVEYR
jgi:hypothetical protein